ncbi:hypothetical protein AA313_de0205103 [Arthrobotrys entomopaga]|nr:hypothetical protein AA313_de0205103 [Arthrobotrys entomopaga]
MKSFLSLLAAAACIAPTAFANPLPASKNIQADVCKEVVLIVDLLKLNKATPFCSSFLGIKTATVQATTVSTSFATATITNDVYTTVTEIASTEVIALTDETTVATVPTTVSTEVVPFVTTVTVTSAPAQYVIFTTIYTTPGARARSATVKRRAVCTIKKPLPTYITKYASSAIWNACRSLSITAPTVTVTTQTVQPATVTSNVVSTITNTVYATKTVSTTEIIQVTSYDPKTLTTTSTVTSFTTTTLPLQQTVTSTIAIPFVTPYCVNILQENKLYYYGYISSDRRNEGLDSFGVPGGDYGLSLCCQKCYETPDCSLWNYKNYSTGPECQVLRGQDQLATGVSATCPRGIDPNSKLTGPGTSKESDDSGYYSTGIGPCFKGDFA